LVEKDQDNHRTKTIGVRLTTAESEALEKAILDRRSSASQLGGLALAEWLRKAGYLQ
jgi:hypothetical protein